MNKMLAFETIYGWTSILKLGMLWWVILKNMQMWNLCDVITNPRRTGIMSVSI